MSVQASSFGDDITTRWTKVQYDFAENGGAVGTILLDLLLPDKSIIFNGFIDVVTPPTSGGSATIALGLNTTTDLKAATAIASYTGIQPLTPVGSAATAVKLTAQRQLQLTIATAALTAGKINIFVQSFTGN